MKVDGKRNGEHGKRKLPRVKERQWKKERRDNGSGREKEGK